MGRVMLYCQATAGLMITELHNISSENLFAKTGECFRFHYFRLMAIMIFFSAFHCPFLIVVAVSNLACGLFNRHLYDYAFMLIEILCKDLCRNCPVSLSVDRVSF